MQAIKQCSKEEIDIRLWTGVVRVLGWRCQEFAVHQLDEDLFSGWCISHLPSGHLVATGFKSEEDAAEAMVAISKLRNDWAIIGNDDLTRELRNKVAAIAEAHGGSVTGGKRPYKAGLNGYCANS